MVPLLLDSEIPPHSFLQTLAFIETVGEEMTDRDSRTLPFQCQHCQRRFKRLEHVQRHERTHTKEAPYGCACGKSFPRG